MGQRVSLIILLDLNDHFTCKLHMVGNTSLLGLRMHFFNQLQAGLKLTLIESPVFSGSTSYKQLCVTAKQEEKRRTELRRLKQQQERQGRTQNSR